MKPFERSNNKRRSDSIIKVRKFKVKRGRKPTKEFKDIKELRKWLAKIKI